MLTSWIVYHLTHETFPTVKLLVTCVLLLFAQAVSAQGIQRQGTRDISCEESILTGLQFNRCGIWQKWKSPKGGENQASWANYVDGTSELQVQYLTGINGGGGLVQAIVHTNEIVKTLQVIAPKFTYESSNWGTIIRKSDDDYYVSYERPSGKKCLAFYRRGEKTYTDTWGWVMYAFFCRVSEALIPISEGVFLVDLIKIRK